MKEKKNRIFHSTSFRVNKKIPKNRKQSLSQGHWNQFRKSLFFKWTHKIFVEASIKIQYPEGNFKFSMIGAKL